jgi:branched-chain amino acid transport system permease protein
MYLFFAFSIAAFSTMIIWRIVKSPFGKLLEAVRDDEVGLAVLGKNTAMLKYKAMILSAFFAGIAGSVFAHYISFIDPATFDVTELILILTIVIAGGIASIKGSIVASIVIIIIPETLRFLALPSSVLGPMRHILYAIILLAILLYRPRGLFGRVDLHA